ncbi:sulfite exporter TauE/SafE family protein [Candidatus Nanosalina sp. VS9-1]|uniref:sulfite exporter TauE/SafE family protein n=1 Tax=Candidatus Nanosalina sp. VS9-1 TaxID=3388566 RepID=UPI0039E0C016
MEALLAITAAVFLGGLVKGINGFGYALVSTPLLALMMPVQDAVALMIIPLVASNIELASQSSISELENCTRKFSGIIISLLAGVTAGMLALTKIPSRPLEIAVGLTALVFVLSQLQLFEKFFSRISTVCFNTWEPVIGFLSGIVYGATNVAVTVVAYLKSQNLSHRKFTATLAITILGISVYRVFLAEITGLYAGTDRIIFSLLLGIPAVIAVKIGQRSAGKLPEKTVEKISLVTIAAIGLRLITG